MCRSRLASQGTVFLEDDVVDTPVVSRSRKQNKKTVLQRHTSARTRRQSHELAQEHSSLVKNMMRATHRTGFATKALALSHSGRATDLCAKTDRTDDHRHGHPPRGGKEPSLDRIRSAVWRIRRARDIHDGQAHSSFMTSPIVGHSDDKEQEGLGQTPGWSFGRDESQSRPRLDTHTNKTMGANGWQDRDDDLDDWARCSWRASTSRILTKRSRPSGRPISTWRPQAAPNATHIEDSFSNTDKKVGRV